jgi:putative redox protein
MRSEFTPMELFLFSLAGCTAMDVQWILERQRQKISRFEIAVRGRRREKDPRFYESIELDYFVEGDNIKKDAVERAIRLSQEKYCSVRAMIKDTVKIMITIRISDQVNPEEKYTYLSTTL